MYGVLTRLYFIVLYYVYAKKYQFKVDFFDKDGKRKTFTDTHTQTFSPSLLLLTGSA